MFSREATRSRMKILYPKNKPTKNDRNRGNSTKRTSEPHERAINSKKKSQCHLFFRCCRKGFNFCWRSKAIVEPKLAPQKIDFEEALHTRGACFHAFHTNGQIGHTCVGPRPQKLRWPRAPRFLNPSLVVGIWHLPEKFKLINIHEKSNHQTLFLYSEKKNDWQMLQALFGLQQITTVQRARLGTVSTVQQVKSWNKML